MARNAPYARVSCPASHFWRIGEGGYVNSLLLNSLFAASISHGAERLSIWWVKRDHSKHLIRRFIPEIYSVHFDFLAIFHQNHEKGSDRFTEVFNEEQWRNTTLHPSPDYVEMLPSAAPDVSRLVRLRFWVCGRDLYKPDHAQDCLAIFEVSKHWQRKIWILHSIVLLLLAPT